ncbi:MAG: TIGR03936 family radical SAM-associated protein, partial [Deltaproteobacteria bacterium]
EAARPRPRRKLHVSVSTFVPKAHTPFQWEAQLSLEEIQENLAFFKQHLRKRGLHFKWHKLWQSVLEGVFTRGDRRLAEVILRAQELGCRFDGWSDHLRVDLWQQAFAAVGIDPLTYGERSRGFHEVLPWSHLDCGVNPDYLWQEYERALNEDFTSDCRTDGCNDCGVCDHQTIRMDLHPHEPVAGGGRVNAEVRKDECHSYRLLFSKSGKGRFLSHLEMITAMERAIRRAKLPLAYTQGYHPSPRVSYDDALPLGLESQAEVMKLILLEPLRPSEIGKRLNDELPAGLEILEVAKEDKDTRQMTSRMVTYEATLKRGVWPIQGFRRFQNQSLAPLRQSSKRGETLIQLTERLLSLESLDSHTIRFTFTEGQDAHLRVRDLLMHIFALSKEEILDAHIVKVSTEGRHCVH